MHRQRESERVKRAIGRGTATGLNPLKDKEKGTSFQCNGQQTWYVFAMGKVFVSCQWKYETWLESFAPAVIWAGPIESMHHLFQWWTRKKVLGGNKKLKCASPEPCRTFPCNFRIPRCIVLYVLVCSDPLLVESLLQTDFPRMYFSSPSPPPEIFWELLSKP